MCSIWSKPLFPCDILWLRDVCLKNIRHFNIRVKHQDNPAPRGKLGSLFVTETNFPSCRWHGRCLRHNDAMYEKAHRMSIERRIYVSTRSTNLPFGREQAGHPMPHTNPKHKGGTKAPPFLVLQTHTIAQGHCHVRRQHSRLDGFRGTKSFSPPSRQTIFFTARFQFSPS